MNSLNKKVSFQDIFTKLCDFWRSLGCTFIPPAQTEISSPLFHPSAFFNMITGNGIDIMYFQPNVASSVDNDMKYNIQNYSLLKFQVILNSSLEMPQETFLKSLSFLGLNYKNANITFENNNFDNFIFRLNASGYKVCFNGTPIARIYYIQNIGSVNSSFHPLTILYDLDKILTIVQDCPNIWDISWNGGVEKKEISYADIMLFSEKGNYDFVTDESSNEIIFKGLEGYKEMAEKMLDNNIITPAYIFILKAKYCLDLLNLKNYVSHNSKMAYNRILRELVDLCCEKYNEIKINKIK